MKTTEQVWEHHAATFLARDLDGVLEDYSDDTVLVLNGEKFVGREAIGKVYAGLFEELPKDCDFELPNCVIEGQHIYITWKAESDKVRYEFATDTFFIDAGKIAFQTIGAVKQTKSA